MALIRIDLKAIYETGVSGRVTDRLNHTRARLFRVLALDVHTTPSYREALERKLDSFQIAFYWNPPARVFPSPKSKSAQKDRETK